MAYRPSYMPSEDTINAALAKKRRPGTGEPAPDMADAVLTPGQWKGTTPAVQSAPGPIKWTSPWTTDEAREWNTLSAVPAKSRTQEQWDRWNQLHPVSRLREQQHGAPVEGFMDYGSVKPMSWGGKPAAPAAPSTPAGRPWIPELPPDGADDAMPKGGGPEARDWLRNKLDRQELTKRLAEQKAANPAPMSPEDTHAALGKIAEHQWGRIQSLDQQIAGEKNPARKAALQSERLEAATMRGQVTRRLGSLSGTMGEAPKVLEPEANRAGSLQMTDATIAELDKQLAELGRPPTAEEMRTAQREAGRQQLYSAGRADLARGPNQADADEFMIHLGRGASAGLSSQDRAAGIAKLLARRDELRLERDALAAAPGTAGHMRTMAQAEHATARQHAARDQWEKRLGEMTGASAGELNGPPQPGPAAQARELGDQRRVAAAGADVAEEQRRGRMAKELPLMPPGESLAQLKADVLREALQDPTKRRALVGRVLDEAGMGNPSPETIKGVQSVGKEAASVIRQAMQGSIFGGEPSGAVASINGGLTIVESALETLEAAGESHPDVAKAGALSLLQELGPAGEGQVRGWLAGNKPVAKRLYRAIERARRLAGVTAL